MDETFHALIRNIRAAGDIRALWRLVIAHFEGHGAKMIAYRHVVGDLSADTTPTVFTHGIPDEIIAAIISHEQFRQNPIVDHALNKTEPFFWNEVDAGAFSSEELDYLDLVRSLVPGEGLIFQVFGPRKRAGAVNLGFGVGGPRPDGAAIREMQVCAQIAHLQYCKLVPLDSPEEIALTGREREVLEWIAKGKSNSVIGDILGISAHTVDTHVRRIFRKLEVNDRTTAAVKGLGAGLVQTAA